MGKQGVQTCGGQRTGPGNRLGSIEYPTEEQWQVIIAKKRTEKIMRTALKFMINAVHIYQDFFRFF